MAHFGHAVWRCAWPARRAHRHCGQPAPAERLADLLGRLAPGGRVAIVSQPRCHAATAGTSRSAADEIENLLRIAGFTQMSTETLPLSPPVICVLAAAPGPHPEHAPKT